MSESTSAMSVMSSGLPEVPEWRRMMNRVLGHRGLLLGSTILGAIVLLALFAPWLAPHDPFAQNISQRMIPPVWHDKGTWDHIFGTDKLGRDYLSRLLYGARISLSIGLLAALISGLIGTTLGVLAGYFGGRVDAVISYIITTRLALPVLLVALAMASLVGYGVLGWRWFGGNRGGVAWIVVMGSFCRSGSFDHTAIEGCRVHCFGKSNWRLHILHPNT